MDLFLDVNKKVWNIGSLQIPVIEDVPMKDLEWFTEKSIEAEKLKNNPEASITDGLRFDEEWWSKICELGLGKSKKEIVDTGISPRQFRMLMQEVFTFLTVICTIEEAKLLGIYEVETKSKEKKR